MPLRSNQPRRNKRRVCVFAGCLVFLLGAIQGFSRELRTAAEIRQLSFEETQRHAPVHLRGVLTFYDERLYSYFVQDSTAGIYLQFPANSGPPDLAPGQLVDVAGFCSPGEYAPVVVVSNITALGTGPLPEPKSVTYEQLASGVEDSQYIELTGIVRSVRPAEDVPYQLLDIAAGGGRLLVYAKDVPVKPIDRLCDSTVHIRGVCSTKFNHKRQLFAIRIMVPRAADLEITSPAPKDPFAIAARPIGSLLQFAPREQFGHRVKVVGTVIYQRPGQTIFLEDGEQGVEVQTEERKPLHLGDRVEVLGFVGQGDYTPLLQNATYRKIGSTNVPAPAILTADEVLKGDHDCRLVQVTGRVLDRAQYAGERSLILQSGAAIFSAYLNRTDTETFSRLPRDSIVSVIGVCQIEPGEWAAGEAWRAKGFRLQLRSAADVSILRAPPWWTVERVLWMAGAMAMATLAAFGWVAILRQKVAQRTRELEAQIRERQRAERQREIEQERARVAHDLHDDLGAGLTEVNMLSSLVKSPTTSGAEKQRYLDDLTSTARRMVTSLDEIVWAVNPRNDTMASLASYFGSYAQRLLSLAGMSCGLDIAEDLPEHPLDPKFRQELFLAFKEALTNSVRHSHATKVWIRISGSNNRLIVEVSDNGRGFALDAAPAGADGLTNMKDRMKSVAGVCELSSEAGTGTTVRFSAPLPERLM